MFSTTFFIGKCMQKVLIFISEYDFFIEKKILITYLLFIIKLENQPNTVFFPGFILIHPAVNTNYRI